MRHYPDDLITPLPVKTGALETSGQITMVGSGKSKIELRPDLDETRIVGIGKPTRVYRGVIAGYSLPIYAADDEELFFNVNVPNRWDGESNITGRVLGWIDTANTNKNFNLQLSWEHYSPGDIVSVTMHDVEVETNTGTAAQYKSFEIEFILDYDIHTPDILMVDDSIGFRLRRIAASSNEIAGEFVVEHFGLIFDRDKMGTPA